MALSSKIRLFQNISKNVFKIPRCNLNLMEYQSKSLLNDFNIDVQKFVVVGANDNIDEIVKQIKAKEYVIKAQILAGGRGKGIFDTGFKSGVHFTENKNEIKNISNKMLGHKLITKQTPKSGIEVTKVMVAESVNIKRETYLCILLDREHNGPVVGASPVGGVDIESVAKETPDKLKIFPIDIFDGVTDQIADKISSFLEFKGDLKSIASKQIKNVWELFKNGDLTQLEINPFVETSDGRAIAVDAKLAVDDNAKFRQKKILDYADEITELDDPREIEASKLNLNFIALDGNIGCLVNGAGLAMATMDIIKLNGGNPANFLDVGGGVQEDQVKGAFKILMSDKNIKSILINVFGGIVNCATIANGIVNSCKEQKLNVPLVVRLEGTNVQEAKNIITNSGFNIVMAKDLEDAAQKVVQLSNY